MAQTKWVIDPMHSEIQFKVKHLMITTVTGYFSSFDAKATTEGEDFTTANISFTADINSISTNSSDRDNHLKSPDFFDAAQYPKLEFNNGRLEQNGGDYKLVGDMTIKNVTNKVSLDAEFGGTVVDGYGQNKVGFTLSGKINRKDFGLTWSAVTEAGKVVVSDEVRINIEVQMTQVVEEPAKAEA